MDSKSGAGWIALRDARFAGSSGRGRGEIWRRPWQLRATVTAKPTIEARRWRAFRSLPKVSNYFHFLQFPSKNPFKKFQFLAKNFNSWRRIGTYQGLTGEMRPKNTCEPLLRSSSCP